MILTHDIFNYIHDKQIEKGSGVLPYGSFMTTPHELANAINQPEELCYAACMLMVSERILIDSGRNGDGEPTFSPPQSFSSLSKILALSSLPPSSIIQRTLGKNFPDNARVEAAAEHREIGRAISARRTEQNPQNVIDSVRKIIVDHPEEFCKEDRCLVTAVSEHANIGTNLVSDAVVALECQGILVPHQHGGSSYWPPGQHPPTPQGIDSSKSVWRILAEH